MAFDFVQPKPEVPVMPIVIDLLDKHYLSENGPSGKSAMTWRHSIFSIVHDCLDQIELNHNAKNGELWQQEARQRALNFTLLGLSEIGAPQSRVVRANQPGRDITAIEGLGGAYRLLARSSGKKPRRCEHVFRFFLKSLAQSYAPVCGEIELGLVACPIVLSPVSCRSMILCVGMLIQGVLRQASCRGVARRLDVELAGLKAGGYALTMRLTGCLPTLLSSPEFALASRLCGGFGSELSFSETQRNELSILLSFPCDAL